MNNTRVIFDKYKQIFMEYDWHLPFIIPILCKESDNRINDSNWKSIIFFNKSLKENHLRTRKIQLSEF